MNRLKKILAPLALLFMALLMQACTDNNPSEPSSQSVVGSWKLLTQGGQDVSALGIWWSFTQTQSTVTSGAVGCSGTFNYTTTGSKLKMTMLSSGCDEESVGSTTELTYSVSGTKLTVTDDGVVYVFEKGQSTLSELVGTWRVLTIDGAAPSNQVTMSFTPEVMSQTAKNNAGAECTMQFVYEKSGNTLDITTIDDECGLLEVGTTDELTYSLSGNKLTLTYSDGTKFVSQKL